MEKDLKTVRQIFSFSPQQEIEGHFFLFFYSPSVECRLVQTISILLFTLQINSLLINILDSTCPDWTHKGNCIRQSKITWLRLLSFVIIMLISNLFFFYNLLGCEPFIFCCRSMEMFQKKKCLPKLTVVWKNSSTKRRRLPQDL